MHIYSSIQSTCDERSGDNVIMRSTKPTSNGHEKEVHEFRGAVLWIEWISNEIFHARPKLDQIPCASSGDDYDVYHYNDHQPYSQKCKKTCTVAAIFPLTIIISVQNKESIVLYIGSKQPQRWSWLRCSLCIGENTWLNGSVTGETGCCCRECGSYGILCCPLTSLQFVVVCNIR